MPQGKSQKQKAQGNQDVTDKDEPIDPTADFIFEGSAPTEEEKPKDESEDDDGDSDDEDDESNEEESNDESEGDDEDDESHEEESDDDEEEKPKKKPRKKQSAQDRIKELTAARRRAEREASTSAERLAALEARLAKIEAPDDKGGLTDDNNGAKLEELKAPDPNEVDPKTGKAKYEYGEFDPDFRKAEREYDRAIIRQELRADMERSRQDEAASEQATELSQKRDAHLAKGSEKYDDFEDVVLGEALADVPDPGPEAAALILNSENGDDIMYHLAKNPEEATEMASKPLVEQARYIGRLEAKFSSSSGAPKKKTKKKVSKAPPPPENKARGTDTKSTVADDTEDFGAFAAKHGIRSD